MYKHFLISEEEDLNFNPYCKSVTVRNNTIK